MNQFLDQYAKYGFATAAEKLMRANYEFASELVSQQLQFAQQIATNGAQHAQRFRNARNTAELLNAHAEYWTSSMETAAGNLQSTLEITNRSRQVYSGMLENQSTKQSPATRRKKTARKSRK